MAQYETRVNSLIGSVYDNARAFSLRGRDDDNGDIDYLDNVIRMRLACRASENLLLTDEVLIRADTNWDELKAQLESWIQNNPKHKFFVDMQEFQTSGFDRKAHDLKNFRNIITGMITNKPWEVLVGQSINRFVE